MERLPEIAVRIDGVNTSRGADQAIVYTAAFGASTATNEYGYEITVENGVITQLGGNDSPIPSSGFVLSLHGAVMTDLRARITKGMSVRWDTASQTVVFAYDAAGLSRAVAFALDRAQACIDRAKAAFVYADYESAQAQLKAIRQESDAVPRCEADVVSVERDLAYIEAADALCRTLCDSYPVQYRGVWVRPSQQDAAQVEAYIKSLHEAHINLVCVEGWFANGVIMEPPQGSLFSPHPQFTFDVLRAYVEACHKYGMECHLWMPILNVGSFYDEGYEHTPAGRKPEWMSLDNKGSSRNPNGFMMIDPANKEACAYLLEFYRYIVTNYDIDGFEMDYIRYYAASAEADYGYTQAAFAGFEEAYGYGVTPSYDPQAAYWDDWCQYRRDCVTALARSIRTMLDKEAPDVLLAADVAFPFTHALHAVYQDFPQWLEEGLLDLLHPMAYGDGYGEDICKAVTLAGSRCMVVTGLGAQGDLLRTEELERQARENASYGAYGECYFEAAAYAYKHLPQALGKTAYRRPAVSPFLHASNAVCGALAYMLERAEAVVYPSGGLHEAEVTALKAAVTRICQDVSDGLTPFAGFDELHRIIAQLNDPNAARVLENDRYRAEHILCVKHRIQYDKEKRA
ncbi:MAG: hypothetical protein E7553_07790 [Ruminococcaceae bacterium]|nr:hypothetical protein [Oscillospiraceae bacterium]